MAPFNYGAIMEIQGDARLSTSAAALDAAVLDTRLKPLVQIGMTPFPAALENILLMVQAIATITTVAQYLSPYPVIRKIVKQNNTGNFSYFPYLANFLNATLTTVYGFLLRDNTIMLVNSFGITVTGTYLIMYQRYYPKRISLLKNLGMCCLTMVGTCHYATIILEEASGRLLMGTAQNCVSIASFLAPLATLRIVFERRSAESVPFLLTIMNFFSSLAWFCYGVLIQDKFVSFPNGLGVVLSLLTFSLFFVYPPPRLGVV